MLVFTWLLLGLFCLGLFLVTGCVGVYCLALLC